MNRRDNKRTGELSDIESWNGDDHQMITLWRGPGEFLREHRIHPKILLGEKYEEERTLLLLFCMSEPKGIPNA